MKRTPPPRLSLLAASREPVALILRRGPSKWVEAIRWDMRRDAFERGQWFYGRIHEERSDLSPNGELLVYLAMQRYVTQRPEERVKRSPKDEVPSIILTRRLEGSGSIRKEFRLEGASDEVEFPPGPLDWLDWDSQGRLIALSGGRIWAATLDENRVGRFAELLDVREDRPEGRIPPRSASEW